MKKIFIVVGLATLITACGSTKFDQLDMQKAVAYKLGLASSDEVTISNVKESETSSVGGKKVSLDATTVRNKKYKCTFDVTPALMPFDAPTTSNMACKTK